MTLDEGAVGRLVAVGAAVFHPVLLLEALELAMAEHGQSGHGRHHRAYAEIFVSPAELGDRGLLVGIVHEVDEALEDVLVEFLGVADRLAVLRVLLALEHVHEGGVVHPMHAEGADEVALHHPEGLGEKEGVGSLARAEVHDLAPEFLGHRAVEVLGRERLV